MSRVVGVARHLLAATAKLSQHAWQIRRRLDVLGGVDSDGPLDLTVTMAEIDCVPNILVDFRIRRTRQALAIFEVDQLRIAVNEGTNGDSHGKRLRWPRLRCTAEA